MSALPPCCASVALFVFVGFSDDRRLALVVRFGVAVFVFVITSCDAAADGFGMMSDWSPMLWRRSARR